MNVTQQGVIALLKSAITGEKTALPEEFDIEQALPLLHRHSVTAMGYVGALTCGVSKELPAMQQLRLDYYTGLVKSEGQLAAIEKITQAFDGHEIDYMPLKGCNMKRLYPAPELRAMGDADILIRTEQYPRIRPILEELGFAESMESDHELVWDNKQLHLELHKRLIPSRDKDYYRYYGDGWGVARQQNGGCYAMSDEDTFVYLFTHFAKHYRNGGIGCRHVTDLWVYLRSFPDMDMAYIHRELEKLVLLEFYTNINRVIDGWFCDGEIDEKADFITQIIFASGNWGAIKERSLSESVYRAQEAASVKKGKLRWFVQLAFPPREIAGYKYPILKKHPILLPAVWVMRWLEAVFCRWDTVKSHYRALTGNSVAEIESHEQSLNYVGLRFEKE